MTFRCNRPDKQQRTNVAGVALLLLLCAVGSTSVAAQNDGTVVPPAPKVKQSTDVTPDPDFKSPLGPDGSAGPGGFGAGGPGPGGFGPGGPGPGSFGVAGRSGFGPGAADDGGPDGMPPRRFGNQGFGAQGFSGAGTMRPHMRRFLQNGGLDGPGFGAPGAGFPPGSVRSFGGVRARGAMGGQFGGRKLDLTPLNLTEDQKTKIKSIRQANRDRAKDFRQTLIQKQQALHSLIFSPTATDDQIRAARKEVRKAQDSLEEIGLNDLLQIRGLLTAEQRQRLPQIAPSPPGRRPAAPQNATASATTSARRIEK